MSDTLLLNVGLPKWPQMYTTGMPVSEEQAKEIIRRTDFFFVSGFGGNDHEYNFAVKMLLGMPLGWSDKYVAERYRVKVDENRSWEAADEWRKKWGVLATSYVRNDWVSCAFIFGPHGWCHPTGEIGFVDNVGKWPSVGDILEDWQTIATAFTFLDIGVSVMSMEEGEDENPAEGRIREPLVSIVVKDGQATLVQPSAEVHERHPAPRIDRGRWIGDLGNPRKREHGIPGPWFREWAASMTADQNLLPEVRRLTDRNFR